MADICVHCDRWAECWCGKILSAFEVLCYCLTGGSETFLLLVLHPVNVWGPGYQIGWLAKFCLVELLMNL